MTHAIDTKYLLPSHYSTDYPKFIEFMNLYFDWLYNTSGFSKAEIESMIEEGYDKAAISLAQSVKNPGASAQEMAGNRMLERSFDRALTLDGLEIETKDGAILEFETRKSEYTSSWLKDFGFPITQREPGTSKYRNIDPTRLVKLLAHIYSIRGSVKCMELFFSVFYNGAVGVKFPRENIATIDGNMVLDGASNSIRDDDYYSEYSYVISVSGVADPNLPVFIELYKSMFHPSGFKMFIEEGFNPQAVEKMKEVVEGYRIAGMVTLPRRFSRYLDSNFVVRVESGVERLESMAYKVIPSRFNQTLEYVDTTEMETKVKYIEAMVFNVIPSVLKSDR
ncbi:head closure Hc2 [Vibrio phage D528]|nr:hypothetical protein MYOV002v2_p0196 [Vibrio phage 144E46.1]